MKRGRWLWIVCAALLAGLAGCTKGSTIVTLTATPSTDTFLTYRVGLDAVELATSSGVATNVLPAATTVDLARLGNLSEVLAAASLTQGTYTQLAVTLDYSSATIVYDDGSAAGLQLTPVGASGQSIGQVTLTLALDSSDPLDVVKGVSSLLALDFKLAASNIVNTSNKTVTVIPLMAASASPIDSKTVHIRGPLGTIDTSTSTVTLGLQPFDFPTAEQGQFGVVASSTTTYEIDGTPGAGSGGLSLLATLASGAPGEAYATLSLTTSTANALDGTSTSLSTVTLTATEILAGSSVQSSSFDRISGLVVARSGDAVTLEDATLIDKAGNNSFLAGATSVTLGSGTKVTEVDSGSPATGGIQAVSVGSRIAAFGIATVPGSGSASLDASTGRVRLDNTTASGLVTVQGSGSLTLNLAQLGGRSLGVFDFAGTGTSVPDNANPAAYQVTTAGLDLSNSTVGAPVEVSGFVTTFGAAPPDLAANALLDPTTINAQLVLDWSAGTTAPFSTLETSEIIVNAQNSAISGRDDIQVGAQNIAIVGLASDPIIVPSSTDTNTVFTIGHLQSGTYENFVGFSDFVTQLSTELNGSVPAIGLTALGQYTVSTYTFSATSITLYLDD